MTEDVERERGVGTGLWTALERARERDAECASFAARADGVSPAPAPVAHVLDGGPPSPPLAALASAPLLGQNLP